MNKHPQLSYCLNGNALALFFYENYHEPLFSYARNLCKRFGKDASFADDLLQEFYVSVLERSELAWKGYRSHGLAYLRQMIRFDLIDQQRKDKSAARMKKLLVKQVSEKTGIYACYGPAYIERFLEDISELLSADNLRLMKLYLEGYSYAEIGEKLDMNPKTVGVRIHRVKKMIKECSEYLPAEPVA